MNALTNRTRITPVILCGGAGTRLWPLSTQEKPKQFHALDGAEMSLLQQTLLRVTDPVLFSPAILVCAEDHAELVRTQADQAGVSINRLIAEPEGRNTTAAIAAAAHALNDEGLLGPMMVLPADHQIGDAEAFRYAAVGQVPPHAAVPL